MSDQTLSLLKRFIQDDFLSTQELKVLKRVLEDPRNSQVIDIWMHDYWDLADEVESNTSFSDIIGQVNQAYQTRNQKIFWDRKWVKQLQKIAAILILPLVLVSAYLVLSRVDSNLQYAEAIVPNGQKSEIVLPDNTHIWLNSGTRLKYPVKFGSGKREVFLDGEAYFEVAHNANAPFIVNAKNVAVKVLGTTFNVKAYYDESQVETALLSGKIKLLIDNRDEIDVHPGELVNISGSQKSVSKSGFNSEEIVGWKNNRLVFRDDTFSNLVKKIERWYDVEIIYDEKLYDHKRLTVELREGESIDRLMQIIEKTMNINYHINKQKIYIKPKMKS
jgi:ferric-dicitrate binding protein FerR (iron transport regulator)